MELLIIALVAMLTSGMTFFSGFGLGTILVPMFALFFPLPLAIAAAAVVHFTNNLFKFALMARQADWKVVARFGLPAALAAILGASSLALFDRLPALLHYSLAGLVFEITAVKVLIGGLIALFAMLELSHRFQSLTFSRRWLSLGGFLSGFFGGLSGNQGALRSAFLLKAGLSMEAFVATGIVSATIVDVTRLLVYGSAISVGQFAQIETLALPVAVGTLAALIGSLLAKRLLDRKSVV